MTGGAGGPSGPVGGGNGGHGAAVVCLAAPGWRGLGVGVAYGQRGNGKPDGVCGRRGWWTWGCRGAGGGAWGSGSGGSGAQGGRGGALGGRSGASEWLRGGGGVGSVSARGGCAARGGSGTAAGCGTVPRRSSWASKEVSEGPGGPRRGAAWYWGGGSPPPSLDPPRRGAAAAAAGGTGPVTVPGGVGPGGALWRGQGDRGDAVPGTGGRPLVVGGVWGWCTRWLPSHTLMLLVHGGLWPH